MLEFEGCKFIPSGKVSRSGWDYYGNPVYKDDFMPTKAYSHYLQEKRKEKERLELQKLKEKLEYEMETTGEVDPVDSQRYMYLVQQSYIQ